MAELPAAYDPAFLHRDVALMSREPFRALLAELIEAKPTKDNVRIFAEKYPDRWAQAVTQVAKLAGYSERIDVHASGLAGLVQELLGLSDADLYARAQEHGAARSLDALPPKGLAAGPTDAPAPPENHSTNGPASVQPETTRE